MKRKVREIYSNHELYPKPCKKIMAERCSFSGSIVILFIIDFIV